MQFPIIYLHIPKTAGTSFRVSAREHFGKKNILSDYGEDSPATSALIIDHFYTNPDLATLHQEGIKKKFMSGHFTLAKYRDIFPDSPVMTFFRDPVKRVVSEYVHFKNHFNYAGTLCEFYRSSQFQNRQHHILSGAKPTDLDFYGLTERYEESLNLFNSRYQSSLPLSTLNTGNYRGNKKAVASAEQIEEIKHLNQADIAMYQCAVDNFEHQNTALKTAANIANKYRSHLGGLRNNKIVGWIFRLEPGAPVTITIAVNGSKRLSVVADIQRADLVRSGAHPVGNCGFAVPLEDIGSISSGDSISVVTEDGEFELLNSPYVVH